MISTNLKGGIGNQMFQIAAAHALAIRNGTTSCFDLDRCNTQHQGNPSNKYKDNILCKVRDVKVNYWRYTYNEPKFSYDELPNTTELILNGYFQSERYFIDYKEEIINLFELSPFIDICYDYFSLIGNGVPTTAVHVRRGDYLNNPEFHPVCETDYYKKAMENIGISNFIFISDDMKWVKDNFKGDNIFYSNYIDEISDFKLMTLCDNNIIANSSFSWWAAYLNKNQNKRIIAPKKWFGPKGPKDTEDIIPNSWLIID